MVNIREVQPALEADVSSHALSLTSTDMLWEASRDPVDEIARAKGASILRLLQSTIERLIGCVFDLHIS